MKKIIAILHNVGKKDSIPLGWNMNCHSNYNVGS